MKKKQIIAAVAIVVIGAGLYFGSLKLRVAQPEETPVPSVVVTEKPDNDIAPPATPAPKATVNPSQDGSQETPQPTVSTGSPKASKKPSEATQKPVTSQTPTAPAPTPTAIVEPPTASQKQSGDDSGNKDKSEVTPKPSQSQEPDSSDTPPSGTGYNGEIRGEWGWLDGFGWIKTGGSDGGTGGQIDDSDRYAPGTGLTGNKVGNM